MPTITQNLTGTGSWVAPFSGTIQVECWACGGGGGGTAAVGSGGGGGGGQYAINASVSVTKGTAYSYSAPTAGGAGGAGASDGTTGSDASWASGTVLAKGGTGGKSKANGSAAGVGSTAGGVGTTVYNGGDASAGGAGQGGAGGGGAGSTGAGNAASGTTQGAAKSNNGGAGGAGKTTSGGGNAGSNYGGGGSAGYNSSGSTSRTGGAGAAALITLTYTISYDTPTMVQHASTAMEGWINPNTSSATDGTPFTFVIPNPSLAGNLLAIAIEYVSGSARTFTVTDDQSQTWSTGPSFFDGGETQGLSVFYLFASKAGVTTITMTPDTACQHVQFQFSEFYNVLATDGSNHNNGTGTSLTAGSITTTQNGDLVLAWFVQDSAGPPALTSMTVGSGFTFLSADRIFGTATEYEVQSTAGAINAPMTIGTSLHWIGCAMAFQGGAGCGTAPTAVPRIIRRLCSWLDNGTSWTLQQPCSGNVLVSSSEAVSGDATQSYISTITDSHSNTWTRRVQAFSDNATTKFATEHYDSDAASTTTSAGTTITVTFNQTAFECMFVLYDCVMPLSSGNFDKTATTKGQQTSTANLTTVSITPSTANGLVFTQTMWDYGSGLALVSPPSGTYSDLASFPQATGFPTDSLEENNGRAHSFNPNTSAITYAWSYTAEGGFSGVGYWTSAAVAYKGTIAFVAPPPFPGIPQALLTI